MNILLTSPLRAKLLPYLLLIIAGVLCVFAFAPFNQGILIILSFLILFWVLDLFALPKQCLTSQVLSPISCGRSFLLGYVYAITYFATQLYWVFPSLYVHIHVDFWLSLLSLCLFVLYLALFIAFSIMAYLHLRTRLEWFNLLLLFPSLWVLFEWLRGWLLSGFPWCEVGYTQVNNLFFKGFYPVLGNYAVSWLTVSLAGAAFLIIKESRILGGAKRDATSRMSKLKFALMLYLLAFFTAGLNLRDIQYTKVVGDKLSVALIQGNIDEAQKWKNENALAIYESAVIGAHADIVFIPETAIAQFMQFLPKGYLDGLSAAAKKNGAELIVGIPLIIDKENNYVNAALLLTDPSFPYYAKYHLVPYGEYIPAKSILGPVYETISLPMVGFSAGKDDQIPLLIAGQKLAFNICYENGFNGELIRTARDATLMVNLSDMVWYGETTAKDEHLQISQVRALENQRYFIQATNTGLTAIIRPDGTIQSQLPTFTRQTLTDIVEGRTGHTPFENYGNYPIIIFCLMLTLSRFFFRKI